MKPITPPLRLFLVSLAAGVLIVSTGLIEAQQPSPRSQFRLNRERLQARLHAIERGLDYIPGEVIVKFRPGTGPDLQARALSVARGAIAASDQQWVGDALLVRAAGE